PTKDFESTNLITYDPLSGQSTLLHAAVVTINFHFTATQLSAENTATVTLILYNVTKATAIDQAIVNLDFAAGLTQESGSRFNKGSAEKGDILELRVISSPSVTITESAVDFEVAAKQGTIDEVYDYNILSTTSLGNTNTKDDILYLNDKVITNASNVSSIEERVNTIETDTTNELQNDRIDAIETNFATETTERTNADTNLQTQIDQLILQTTNRYIEYNVLNSGYIITMTLDNSTGKYNNGVNFTMGTGSGTSAQGTLMSGMLPSTVDGTNYFALDL
ncbi:MAG: hypothetical protein ACK5MR_17755, partial [Cumulibacter sp.]